MVFIRVYVSMHANTHAQSMSVYERKHQTTSEKNSNKQINNQPVNKHKQINNGEQMIPNRKREIIEPERVE